MAAGPGAETPDAELERIFAARNRDAMAPTISALLDVDRRFPDNPRVLYEVGGAYDTAGEEETAAGYYERALAGGLDGDVLRRCWLQYGSTLRNLGRMEESLAVFARARQEYPDSVSLAVFEALTLYAAGRSGSALGSLLDQLADRVSDAELDRYKPAIRGNAGYLRSLDGTQ